MPTTTNFKEWIYENVEISNINEVWVLFYQAVTSESDNYFPYEVSRIGKSLYLKDARKGETFAIVSELAKEAFINILEYPYLDQGGIETAKAYDDHMDHD